MLCIKIQLFGAFVLLWSVCCDIFGLLNFGSRFLNVWKYCVRTVSTALCRIACGFVVFEGCVVLDCFAI